jgi:hypothetical protein
MRIRLHILIALFICFLLLVSSFEAQLTRRGGVSGIPSPV